MRKLHTYLSYLPYLLVSLAAFAVATTLCAAPITADQARTAATKFVTSDPIGSAVLKGRTVLDVQDLDGLWIASLAPSGHVILSGSDLVEPIVGFSVENFASPDRESPASVMLDGVRKKSHAVEESGLTTRNAKWEKFLATKTRSLLRAGPVEVSPESIIISPFLQAHYNQWQPYNDFCPVYDSSADTREYRGRTPCGCVATAASQILRHFRWPVRIDKTYQCDHDFVNADGMTTTFPIRFDGRVPLYWSSFEDDYASSVVVSNFNEAGYYIGQERRYDLRGQIAESERYPIARLALWMDVVSQMTFKTNDSYAVYNNVMVNIMDWYTKGELLTLDSPSSFNRLKTDIIAGVPCPVLITKYTNYDESTTLTNGHVVVAHGWAEDLSSQYVYLNFGYGGVYDGFYNTAADFMEYSKKEVFVGCYPRAKPQLAPLPKVCGQDITLNWDFPDFYNNNLSGFTVSVSKQATEPTTFLDDFSNSSGVSSSDHIYVGMDGTYGYDGDLLYAASNSVGTYTFDGSRTLTSASALTFKVLNYCANSLTYAIQASFDDGEWQTIYEPVLDHLVEKREDGQWYLPSAQPFWRVERLFLGGHGGQKARFRIVKGYNWGETFFEIGRILLDDFQVTGVLEQEEVATYEVTEVERSCILPPLEAGVSYSFTVSPHISSALVEGESSDPVLVVVAGNRRVPIPSEQLYQLDTLSFSTSDSSGVWSYLGNPVFVDGVCDDWCDDASAWNINGEVRRSPACKIIASLRAWETLTEDSVASFAWRSSGYQYPAHEYNIITTTFIDEEGVATELERFEAYEQTTEPRYRFVSLGRFAGHSGRIEIKLVHRPVFGDYISGRCMLEGAQVSNVRVPSTTVYWSVDAKTNLGTPAILSVSNVVDGVATTNCMENFYRECKIGTTNEFDVECSEYVTNVIARSSHLSLVEDCQVTTTKIGPNTFRVSVDASGINDMQSRSRMILTLEATDENGSKAYKDLSLRFSVEGEPGPIDPLEVTTSTLPIATNSVVYSAMLEATGGIEPYTWSVADGSGYYEFSSENSFAESGAAQEWKQQDGHWEVLLPFEFPFYDSKYSRVWVNANGTLTFGGMCNVWYPDESTLINSCMIAVLGRRIDLSGGNIYLDESAPGAITIRWAGEYYNTSYPLSFSATLYSDGKIKLSYGGGNIYGGLVGISSGNGIDYILSQKSYSGDDYGDGVHSLRYAQDIVFARQTELPAWLSLSGEGVLSGTPTASGESAFTVFVTDGAGTRISKTLNLSVVPLAPVVTPGENTRPEYTSTEAESAVTEINGNKARYIAIPEVLGDAPAEVKAEYQNMFEAKSEYVNTADAYRIVTELTAAAEQTLANTASNTVETVAAALGEIAEAAAGDQTEVSVTGAQPGFYYSISYGVEPNELAEGKRVQAPANGNVKLTTPHKSAVVTDRGFYKVNVNVMGW